MGLNKRTIKSNALKTSTREKLLGERCLRLRSPSDRLRMLFYKNESTLVNSLVNSKGGKLLITPYITKRNRELALYYLLPCTINAGATPWITSLSA